MYYVNSYYKDGLMSSMIFDNKTEAINHFNYLLSTGTLIPDLGFSVKILHDSTVLFDTEVNS